jgi:hypothetical protein
MSAVGFTELTVGGFVLAQAEVSFCARVRIAALCQVNETRVCVRTFAVVLQGTAFITRCGPAKNWQTHKQE